MCVILYYYYHYTVIIYFLIGVLKYVIHLKDYLSYMYKIIYHVVLK